jgi:hypothetical protein
MNLAHFSGRQLLLLAVDDRAVDREVRYGCLVGQLDDDDFNAGVEIFAWHGNGKVSSRT